MTSRLFKILRTVSGISWILSSNSFRKQRMPKGVLLHVHQYVTVEAGFLLELALQQPAIHIQCPECSCGITDSDAAYASVPNTWVKMRTARETFDSSLGGAEGFDKWIVCTTFVINPSEA
ncbi:hypothetical protein J3R82DRAFT_5764 [Butyriboletus roseoflavus]|nr:hypothetical protein J3R82DRAFT_5764 [Butyriboletus roseoflavus]